MLDCFAGDLDDDDLYAHLVGQSDTAADFSDDPSQDMASSGDVPPDSEDDLGVSALVAASLGNLLLN